MDSFFIANLEKKKERDEFSDSFLIEQGQKWWWGAHEPKIKNKKLANN